MHCNGIACCFRSVPDNLIKAKSIPLSSSEAKAVVAQPKPRWRWVTNMMNLILSLGKHQRISVGISVAAWLLCIGCGGYILLAYSARPTAMSSVPQSIPVDTKLEIKRGTQSLLVFLHPHCPCSKSTVEQLRRILSVTDSRVDCHVLFVNPVGTPSKWEEGCLFDEVITIPGISVYIDDDGCEATRFSAAASGEVLLYDKCQHLVFHGGITPSRGQVGENVGSKAIVELLRANNIPGRECPVFGCPLLNSIQNN